MLIKVSKFISLIFYLIGVVGSLVLYGKFDDFNYAMDSFFGFDSFDNVTNTGVFIFLLANISIGLVIHLLAEVLNYLQLILLEKKKEISSPKKEMQVTDADTSHADFTAENAEREELNSFYSLLLKVQNMFNKR